MGYTDEALRGFIAGFSKAPDSQMDACLAQECADFDGENPEKFLRNLRDKCVWSGSSEFMIKLISMLLEGRKEHPTARRRRHEELKEWTGENRST